MLVFVLNGVVDLGLDAAAFEEEVEFEILVRRLPEELDGRVTRLITVSLQLEDR